MCIQLIQLTDGNLARCQKCWQCKDRKISDWIGRCTAEAKTAVATDCVTLTYAPSAAGSDPVESRVLTLRDVQLFFKRIRKNGHPVRYFVVGEYGHEKGRAHWHCVLFWQSPSFNWPEATDDDRVWIKEWPHGHIHLDPKGDLKAVRYACKYIMKDETESMRMLMSKSPALGEKYLTENLPYRYVLEGMAPQDLAYRFGDNAHREHYRRRLKRYFMHARVGEKFVKRFLWLWREFRPSQPLPDSPLIEAYLDEQAANQLDMDRFIESTNKPVRRKYAERLNDQREARYRDDKKKEAPKQLVKEQIDEIERAIGGKLPSEVQRRFRAYAAKQHAPDTRSDTTKSFYGPGSETTTLGRKRPE